MPPSRTRETGSPGLASFPDPGWRRLLDAVESCLLQAEAHDELAAVHIVTFRAGYPLTFGRTPDATTRLMEAVAHEFARSLRECDLIVPLDRSRLCLLQRNANSLHGVRTVAEKLSNLARDLSNALGADRWAVGAAISDAADNAVAFIGQASAAAECALTRGLPMHIALSRSRGDAIGVSDVRIALERGEFELVMQPQVDLRTRKTRAIEVLTRMHHPLRGLQTPKHFLPAIARAGLEAEFDLWVLAEACRLRCRADLPDDVRIAVNIHPQLLDLDDLPRRLERVLHDHRLPFSQLEIELLECDGLEQNARSECLSQLRDLGIRLVLDDFGIGYSSFDRLVHHPFEKIKLPRELTRHVDSARGEAAVCSVLRFCRELELETTAEGIETATQRDRLCSWGCHNGQGFLLGRPMSRTELEAASGDGSNPRGDGLFD